jgi:tol-pal system protein YbgF
VTDRDFIYLNDQLVALNKRVEGLSQEFLSVREQQAKGDVELRKIREDMQGISGRMDENNRLVRRTVERDTKTQDGMSAGISGMEERISKLDTDVRRLHTYLNLESTGASPVQESERKPSTGSEAEPKVPAVKQAAPAVESPEGLSEQGMYDMNLALYREEKYEEAIAGFKKFVEKYPKSELGDNAQFWVGESYMALKQYEQAILAFQGVIKKYPKGNKVPNALLRQALAFYEIKDTTSSKLLLKKLIKEYPKSNEATIAQEKLKTIK